MMSSTSSSSIPTAAVTAATLNNQGVISFLQWGDLSASLILFKQALEIVAGSIDPPNDKIEESVKKEGDDGQDHAAMDFAATPEGGRGSAEAGAPEPEPEPRSSSPKTRSGNTADEEDLLPPSSRFLQEPPVGDSGTILEQLTNAYIRPINLIPSEGAYDAHDPLANAAHVSSIVLFNLALVFHATGYVRQGGEPSHRHHPLLLLETTPVGRHLLKARDLYRKALDLLHAHDDDASMEEEGVVRVDAPNVRRHHPVLAVLRMALHNNLASVSYALGEFDYCQASLNVLSALCRNVQGSSNHGGRWAQPLDADARAIMEWHANVFLCNAYFLRSPPHVAAAA